MSTLVNIVNTNKEDNMALKDEIKLAEDKGLNYTPPYKLAEMMKGGRQ
jgi:hypothetical protein